MRKKSRAKKTRQTYHNNLKGKNFNKKKLKKNAA